MSNQSKVVTRSNYQNRILKVLDYIWNNLDQPLDNNRLAEIAHFSPYHFHRIYREMMQETVANCIRRLRLHRAAYLLLSSTQSVADIAKSCGYGSAEAFIRAFERHHSMSPGKYRESAAHTNHIEKQALLTPDNQKEYHAMYDVSFKTIENITAGAIKHLGHYMDIGQAFDKLDTVAATHDLLSEDTYFFGVYYDDPESKPAEELESHACMNIAPEQAKAANLELINVQGGKYAVMRFVGPYAQLETAYQWFYGKWLPDSGYEMDDKPFFENYLNDPRDTPPNELITEIHLPIKE